MKLSEHFNLVEFTASDTAERKGIDNTLPTDLIAHAVETMAMMEKIRAVLGERAIHISSGYRCPALNKAIGSTNTSDHVKALAVDFKCPGFGTPYQVAKHLSDKVDSLGIGQLIYEHTWIHVSTRAPSNPINRLLTLRGKGYEAGIRP